MTTNQVGTVMRDEVSSYGQHWLEAMAMGRRPELAHWLERVPQASEHLARWRYYYEPTLDAWRLLVWWPAREFVRLGEKSARDFGTDSAVLWYLDGARVRDGLNNAAALMWLHGQRLPGRIYLRSVNGMPKQTELVDWPGKMVEICLAEWVPQGYLLAV